MHKDKESRSARFLMNTLGLLYDKAVENFPKSASLKSDYYRSGDDLETAIDKLIKFQAVKAGSIGFVTNMGGIITLPVALPANMVGLFYIQIRMIITIADMRGYDIRSDQVKTFTLGCLAGEAIFDIVRDFGVAFSKKIINQLIMKVPGTTLRQINRAVGFRLMTKAGTTGLINLTKIVPFVGGAVAGTVDGIATARIGHVARRVFVARPQNDGPDWEENMEMTSPTIDHEPEESSASNNVAADQN